MRVDRIVSVVIYDGIAVGVVGVVVLFRIGGMGVDVDGVGSYGVYCVYRCHAGVVVIYGVVVSVDDCVCGILVVCGCCVDVVVVVEYVCDGVTCIVVIVVVCCRYSWC